MAIIRTSLLAKGDQLVVLGIGILHDRTRCRGAGFRGDRRRSDRYGADPVLHLPRYFSRDIDIRIGTTLKSFGLPVSLGKTPVTD